MERSPKRRRVSMTRAVSISPIKIATDNAPIATLVSPLRPSYMSPTRSSLARTNPELLPLPRRSLGLDGVDDDDDVYDMMNIGKEKRLAPKRLNPTPLRNTTPNRGSTTPPIRTSLGQGGGTGGDTALRRFAGGSGKGVAFSGVGSTVPDVSAVEQENIPAEEVHASQTTNGDSLGLTGGAPDGEEEMTAGADHGTFADVEGDTGLPKLPSPEMTYGPPGMLSSSPSGQAARRLTVRRSMLPPASRRESALPSSEQDSSPDATSYVQALETQDKTRGENDAEDDSDERQTPAAPADEDTEMIDAADDNKLEETDIALLPKGPIIIRDLEADAKQDELENLLREKRRLEGEVDVLQKAWLGHQEGRGDRPDTLQLLDIVTSQNRAISKDSPKEGLSQRLARLLPFGNTLVHAAPGPVATPDSLEPAKVTLDSDVVGLFSPLQVKSTQKTVLFGAEHMQRHVLDIVSPDGLLSIGLDVDIDPITARIFQIGSHGDWSDWSQSELLEFCKGHLGGEYGPSTCDINAIGKAAACYWKMAVLRAKTWQACIKDHHDLVVNVPNFEAFGEQDSSTHNEIHRRFHLGRRALRLEKAGVCLSINWTINFEWTGDVRSDVTASAAFPSSWRQREDAKSLDNVGELFDLFLRRFGVRLAVKTLVELMFGTND